MILEGRKNFIKADEVSNNDRLEILSEGEWIESKKFTYEDGKPKQQFIIKVGHGGVERDMSLNATNRTNLIQSWGKDTKNWIGKFATVEIVKMAVSGQLKNVIILTDNGQ
jgi:hypothetical protein